ncbi:Arc family DNA-binding protein [Acinetobacter tandoii]|uniref:Arc family DNA-binding protein n=1 Tax=Acinetobacter tandoii TaxID=202954 RepID=A0A5N4X0J9_9GAMM|nr:YlcI/YnfO family protein [Acinetobacter tandoii]KAB1860005.1 Arc family DNA-binding protein [Acinetobacter tandoii]
MSEHKNPQYNLRLPKELKDFLAEQAQKDGRSLNNFIVKSLDELRMTILKKTD